jgi:very-short-patch-repair endonuclease
MSASSQLVLTRAGARAIGVPLGDLRGPRYTRLFYDTYVPSPEVVSLREQSAAVLSRLPKAHHISHHSAVRLWGGVAPDSADVHISMTTREERCRRSGIAAHLASADVRVTTCRGLAISTPVQAFCDLASVGVSLIDLVIAGDSLVKATKLEPAALVEAVGAWSGRHAKRARRAARLVRTGVDSPMETRLRLLLVLAGLPEPEVNFILRAPDGSWRRRFDLCYPKLRLIIEYDGRQHAFDHAQWSEDIARREQLDGLRWRLIVIESDGIYLNPLHTLQRVRGALVDRGARVPRVFSSEWTRHFTAYR